MSGDIRLNTDLIFTCIYCVGHEKTVISHNRLQPAHQNKIS